MPLNLLAFSVAWLTAHFSDSGLGPMGPLADSTEQNKSISALKWSPRSILAVNNRTLVRGNIRHRTSTTTIF
jgi:hypothetical protein